MCGIHLPLLCVGGKAPHESTKYSIYITTEIALVKYHSYLPKILQLFFFTTMFYIFNAYLNNLSKSFAWYNVLLKFDVKKFFVSICIFPANIRIA